jgi:transposase
MRSLKLKRKEIISLKQFIRKGRKSARTFKRANILLLLDQREIGDSIAEKLNVNRDTVYNVKRKYLEDGLDSALFEKPRSGQPMKYDLKKKTEIIAKACTTPPEGRQRWTIRLLAEEMSKQEGFKTINRESIRLTLKKAIPSHG